MSKAHKKKLLFILIVATALVFAARTVPQVSLTERAIVVGLGIDYDGTTYSLSAQIIKPVSQGQASSADDSFGIAEGSGKTIAEAINVISLKTGLTISLSQCNVVILGNSVLETDVFPSINYLVQTYQVPDKSTLLATNEKAVELLRKKPLLTTISAFQLQQTLTTMEDDFEIITTGIKDFMAGYLSKSGTAAVALVTAKELNTDDSGDSQSGQQQEKLYEFDYNSGALFSSGKKAMLLSADDSIAVNFVFMKLKKGKISLRADDTEFMLELKSKTYKEKLKLENGMLICNAEIKLEMFINESENISKYFSVNEIPESVLKQIAEVAKKQVEEKMKATFEKTKKEGYDIYNLYNKAYSKEGLKWAEIAGDDYLDKIEYNISAEIKVGKQ